MNKKQFLDFKDAKEYVHSLGLQTCREWIRYAKSGKKLSKIPYDPSKVYKYCGWCGWKDWLGHRRLYNQNSRKNRVNENYFKKWSSEMAYILGLWWADGYISRRSWSFGITLHKNDLYLLEKVRSLIGGRIYQGESCYNLVVSSKVLFKDVIDLGGQEKKSLILKLPYIPKLYIKDFIRGYFDGDGSIFYAKSDKAYYASITCGNEKFLRDVADILSQKINGFSCYIKSRVQNPIIKGIQYKNIFSSEMRMNARCTKLFGEYIYSSLSELKMKRKFVLFSKIGIIKVANKDKIFLDFDHARDYVKSQKIPTSMAWLEYCRSGNKPKNIPSNPNNVYRNKGWKNWADWLGKDPYNHNSRNLERNSNKKFKLIIADVFENG